MGAKARIPLGSLVTPRESKCGVWETIYLGPKEGWERCYIYTGAIKICEIPNRERPVTISRDLPLTFLGMVLEHNDCKRYLMVKLLTVSRWGTPMTGWALESDVEVIQ
jgi:hypothetical protein